MWPRAAYFYEKYSEKLPEVGELLKQGMCIGKSDTSITFIQDNCEIVQNISYYPDIDFEKIQIGEVILENDMGRITILSKPDQDGYFRAHFSYKFNDYSYEESEKEYCSECGKPY